MRTFVLFLCSCAFLLPYSASAAEIVDSADTQTAERLPHIVASGLKAYGGGGADEAVSAWIRGSVIDGSSQANLLHQIQSLYGAYRTFDVIGVRQFGPRTQIVYLTLDYDKGPLFAKFVAYKSDQGWILASFDFSTKDDILPELPFAASTSSTQP
jgi:hypothetical protein